MEQLLTLPVWRENGERRAGHGVRHRLGGRCRYTRDALSERLDLSRNTDPKKIELDLMKVIPQEKWILFSHQLIWHGRKVCQARKPEGAPNASRAPLLRERQNNLRASIFDGSARWR